MNRLRLARQAFDSLSPALHICLDEATSDRAEAWLRDDVCPVVEELIPNRSFQSTVRWSVDHLSLGSRSTERHLVEEVDRALVELARRLVQVLDSPLMGPQEPSCSSRSWITESEIETLRLVASRPWFDLVSPEEFFDGSRGLHLNESHQAHRDAFLRTELRLPLGDYVARGMFARISYWKRILGQLSDRCLVNCPAGQGVEQWQTGQLFERRSVMDRAVNELREACHHGESARLREASTALTLVYTAYAPHSRLDWLRCPPGWGETSAPTIRMCIRRRGVQRIVTRGTDDVPQITDERPALLCDPDAVRQIAHALQDVTTFYEMPEDPDDVVEWVLNFGRLILVDRSPREVFWDRVAVAPGAWDQSGVQWDLLWTLANNPGQIVHQGLLRNPDGQRIASRRNRMSTLLTDCQELDQRIVNVHGQGYRLEMNAENIILLREDMRGRLAFVDSHHLANR